MVLTKKDFIIRAKFIRSFRNPNVRSKLTTQSIKVFKKSNPKFNEKTFRAFILNKKLKGGRK